MSPPSQQPPLRPNRNIVTEEALYVSPHVLGLPLARPWRRAAAMSVDASLVAILSNAPSVLFGFAAAYVLFRASARRKPGGGYVRRSFRFMLRFGGALVLFVVAMNLWDSIGERIRGGDDGDVSVSATVEPDGGGAAELNVTGMVRFASGVMELRNAENEEAARAATLRLLEQMREAGFSRPDARDMAGQLVAETEGKPWIQAAVQRVLAEDAAAEQDESAPSSETASGASMPVDSLVVAYATALSAGDSAAIDSLRPRLVDRMAADTVGVLAGTITSLDAEREELRSEVGDLREEIEEGPGLVAVLRSFAEDLGLGLGWFGLYFTAMTALWQGRTPGKRLLGIRVISLTGKPIGWWSAFERFGGYAAGFATGLLGFLQILWDDNRQAIHDKIAVTAVILERTTPET